MTTPFQMRYVRHRNWDRLRHSADFKKFLKEQATRLNITEEALFLIMKNNGRSTDYIRSLPTVAPSPPNLTLDPNPASAATDEVTLDTTDGSFDTMTIIRHPAGEEPIELYSGSQNTTLVFPVTVADNNGDRYYTIGYRGELAVTLDPPITLTVTA